MIRRALILVALIALALLIVRPREDPKIGEAQLVTLGAGDVETDLPLVRLGNAPEPEALIVPDLAALQRRHPELESLRVAGYGLPEWEWRNFDGKIDFDQPATPPAGVVHVVWPRRLRTGRDFLIEGVFQDPAGRILRLEGPGGISERFAFEAGDESEEYAENPRASFSFRTRPRAAGSLDYRLVWDAEDGERAIVLDVQVVEPSPPTVLWLETAPSFESRAFKRRLVERGGRVAVRSQVSRGRYRWETGGWNDPDEPAPKALNPRSADLRRFDLIVADPGSLRFPGLDEWIREGGGLLVRIDPNDRLDRLPSSGPIVRRIEDLEQITLRPRRPGSEPLPPLNIAAREILDGFPLFEDDSGRVYAARKIDGRGRRGATLIHDVHRLLLAGESDAYDRYWNRLLDDLARREDGPRWFLPQGPIFVDEPVEIRQSGGPAANIAVIDASGERIEVTPRGDGSIRLLPFRPGRSRWIAETSAGRSEIVVLIVDPAAERGWDAWRAERSLFATKRASLRSAESTNVEPIDSAEASFAVVRRDVFLWTLLTIALLSLWTIERRA